jgi:2-isopropylmalate synthase
VGANAFAHESGIHQDGVLKHQLTYEIMTPESVGVSSNRLVLGKHSGRHALRDRLADLGYKLDDADLEEAFTRFKLLADKKKHIYDEDLEALVSEAAAGARGGQYELVYLGVTCGNKAVPTATVQMRVGERMVEAAGSGDGPVDAAFQVVRLLAGVDARLISYSVSAVTGGDDAQGCAHVVLEIDGEEVSARGTHTDVIFASTLAYVQALNKHAARQSRRTRTPLVAQA